MKKFTSKNETPSPENYLQADNESAKESLKEKSYKKIKRLMQAGLIIGISALSTHGALSKFYESPTSIAKTENDSVNSRIKREMERILQIKKARYNKLRAIDQATNTNLENKANTPASESLSDDEFSEMLRLQIEIFQCENDLILSANGLSKFALENMANLEKNEGVNQQELEMLMANYNYNNILNPLSKQPEKIEVKCESSGFENIGLSSESMKEIFSEKFYPHGTVTGKLAEIKYVDEAGKINENKLGELFTKDKAEVVADASNSVIRFFKTKTKDSTSQSEVATIMARNFSHELAHLNDFFHDSSLKPKERVSFLYDVTNCLQKSELPKKDYYLSHISNVEQRQQNITLATEYFAQLVAIYMEFPEDFENITTQPEQALIKKWFLKNDSSFSNKKSLQQREQFIKKEFGEKKENHQREKNGSKHKK